MRDKRQTERASEGMKDGQYRLQRRSLPSLRRTEWPFQRRPRPRWMDGWIDRWTNRLWMDGWMHGKEGRREGDDEKIVAFGQMFDKTGKKKTVAETHIAG